MSRNHVFIGPLYIIVPLVIVAAGGWGCLPTISASAPAANSAPDLANDRDQDGLSDDDEMTASTDPDNPDTDDDGCPDGLDIAPLVDSISSCPQANANANQNTNANASDNANANGGPGGGFVPGGNHCPFVSGFGLASEPGEGTTRLVIAYASDAGSVRVVVNNQTVTVGPGAQQMVVFSECPQTIPLASVTFDDGTGRLQTYTGITFGRGIDFTCGGTVTLTFTSSCNIALSEE